MNDKNTSKSNENPDGVSFSASSCSPLDDFLTNAEKYNAASVASFITGVVRRSARLTGGEIEIYISGVDTTKSLKSVLRWCAENPQPSDKLSRAIDLMVSGWERAKFMDLLDEPNDEHIRADENKGKS